MINHNKFEALVKEYLNQRPDKETTAAVIEAMQNELKVRTYLELSLDDCMRVLTNPCWSKN